MGCIEINNLKKPVDITGGLIETWDVLKFKSTETVSAYLLRLIETWDVLK